MNFYVASKFENKELVRRTMQNLRDRGHHITADWTIHEAGDRKGEELKKYLLRCAEEDADGVAACDVLLLIDHPACKGAYSELGIAIGLDKKIIVVGAVHHAGAEPEFKQNIFMHLEEVKHVESVEEALRVIDTGRL